MKEDETIEGVYEDGSLFSYDETKLLTENESKKIRLRGYEWLIKYNVCPGVETTLVDVTADFESRYSFPDKHTLEVTIKVADKEITETFDMKKSKDQSFIIDLVESGLRNADSEDIEVTCTICVKNITYCAKDIGTMSIFTASHRPHDVVLLVGEQKFYVHKVYLATWSRFFNNLFYGNFAEKNKRRITIKDVDAEEFNTLMEIIHPELGSVIKNSNVLFLLKLADRFDMPSVMAMCGTHLMNFNNCPDLSLMERLELSDKHNLSHLQIACLKRVHNISPAEYKSFFDRYRERIKNLSVNTMQNLV